MKLYVRITVTLYLLLLLAAGLGYVDLWAVYHLALFPVWLTIGLAAVSLTLLWVPIGLPTLVDRIFVLSRRRRSAIVRLMPLVLPAVVLFILGRSRNHLLGDGYQRLSIVAGDTSVSFAEYMDIYLHRLVYWMFGNAELSYLIVSVIAGILFLSAISLFVRRLSPNPVTQSAAAIAIIGIAQIQFFFGYVESYSIMTAVAALFLYFGFRSTLSGKYLWLAVSAFVAAGFFHVSAWVLAPGVMYLLWVRGGKEGKLAYKIVATLLLLGGITAGVLLYGELRLLNAIVEIRVSDDKLYSLFSMQHLADVGNILLLVAPLPVILSLGALFRLRGNRRLRGRRPLFLLLCAAAGLVYLYAVEPNLGALRDWDLMALFGIPLAFLAAYSAAATMRKRAERSVFLAAGLAVLLMHTVPWVASNASHGMAVEQIKKYVAADVHYSWGHLEGARLKSWGYLMEKYYDDYEEKERAFLLRVAGKPDDVDAWLNLARVSLILGKREQARSALAVIEDFTPNVADRFKQLLLMYIELGEYKMAAQKLSIGIEWFPEDPQVYYIGGVIGQLTGDLRTSAMLYQKAVVLSPNDKDVMLEYAKVLIELGENSEAGQILRRAHALPNTTPGDRRIIDALLKRIGQ